MCLKITKIINKSFFVFPFQSFLDLTNEQPSTVSCQAGFVPPLPSFHFEPQQHVQQQQHQQQSMHLESQQLQQPISSQTYSLVDLQIPQNHVHLDSMHQQLPVHNQSTLSTHDENSYDSSDSDSMSSSWPSPSQTLDESLSGPNNSSSKYSTHDLGLISKTKTHVLCLAPTPTRRRNMGGRRARNAPNLTPVEEEKRKVRRERNKLAAARCRKRRVDQTNELTDKVNLLEKDKLRLQNELQDLKAEKDGLEFLLHDHRHSCRILAAGGNVSGFPVNLKPEFKLPQTSLNQTSNQQQPMTLTIPPPVMLNKIKEEPLDPSLDADGPSHSPKRMLLGNLNPIISSTGGCDTPTALNTPNILPLQTFNSSSNRPSRPNSLAVPFNITAQCKNIADMAGVPISTPSNGVIFNFESLMEGGTGLTPVSQPLMPNYPMLSHRNPDMATPTTEPSKLVSL